MTCGGWWNTIHQWLQRWVVIALACIYAPCSSHPVLQPLQVGHAAPGTAHAIGAWPTLHTPITLPSPLQLLVALTAEHPEAAAVFAAAVAELPMSAQSVECLSAVVGAAGSIPLLLLSLRPTCLAALAPGSLQPAKARACVHCPVWSAGGPGTAARLGAHHVPRQLHARHRRLPGAPGRALLPGMPPCCSLSFFGSGRLAAAVAGCSPRKLAAG